MIEAIEFRDFAAGNALEALLELFLHRPSRIGGVERITAQARWIADEMEKNKTDDAITNYMAVKAMKGILIGNYKNSYEECRMSGIGIEIVPFVQKCFKIAAIMVEKNKTAADTHQ